MGYITTIYGINYFNTDEWQMTDDFTNALTGISAVSENVAYALTGKGQVYKTMNGGNSFSQIAQIYTPGGFADLHFVSEQVGYASIAHNIYQTLDGGVSWKSVVYSTNTIVEIHFTDANHGWACGEKGTVFIYKK